MQIDIALERMESAASLRELSAILQKCIEDAGFAAFEYFDVTRPAAMAPLGAGTASGWRDIYASNRFDLVDPYVARARRADRPFDWASLAPPRDPGRDMLRLMQAAQDFGLREGLLCPHHWRDASGARRHHVCSLFWTDAVDDFRARIAEHRGQLHLLTLYFMQRAIRIEERQALGREGEDGSRLTPREIDVLCWAARGKTSAEAAEILRISRLTADTHMRNAIQKLEASSKTHAVVLAMTRGLLDP